MRERKKKRDGQRVRERETTDRQREGGTRLSGGAEAGVSQGARPVKG